MEEPVVLIFENKEQTVKGLSEHFIKLVNLKQGIFSIALSGGNTPGSWFEELAAHHNRDIEWERIHFYWGDERCVPPDDKDSNYGMAKKYLFNYIDIPEQNIHRVLGELKPQDAAKKYLQELKDNFNQDQQPVFDLIILGLGEDGHTASIFPHQIDLWNADELCVIGTHPTSGQNRVSLAGSIINHAHSVAFLVTGVNKAKKVKEILEKDPAASGYPASLVNPVNGQLFWFIDKAAAKYLTYD